MNTVSKLRTKKLHVLKSDIAKMYIDTITRYAIEDISEIKARIHRIILFCPRDKGPQDSLTSYFNGKFNNVGIISDPVPRKRMKGYKKQLVVKNEICRIYIFINRFADDMTGYLPVFRMEVIPKENVSASEFKKYLSELNGLIANLHLSEVEYTIDLFCQKPSEVETLFLMVRRSLYVPYKNNPQIFDNYPDEPDGKRINSSYYASAGVKVYERGNDENKEKYLHKSGTTKRGWYHNKLNRVRLEHTADRTKLTRNKLDTLSDLLSNCRFHELNNGIYQFRFFKPKSLPKYWLWPDYETEDFNGSKGALQIEYVLGKHIHKNLRQNFRDIEEFRFLRERLIQQMLEFDSTWEQ